MVIITRPHPRVTVATGVAMALSGSSHNGRGDSDAITTKLCVCVVFYDMPLLEPA